jgi:hypothetical protein
VIASCSACQFRHLEDLPPDSTALSLAHDLASSSDLEIEQALNARFALTRKGNACQTNRVLKSAANLIRGPKFGYGAVHVMVGAYNCGYAPVLIEPGCDHSVCLAVAFTTNHQ